MKVRHEGERLSGPGISDNGTGLAALVAIARAMQAAKIKPRRTILFAANVGEGNLRGMRALVDAYRANLKAAIVLDSSGTDALRRKRWPRDGWRWPSPDRAGIVGRISGW